MKRSLLFIFLITSPCLLFSQINLGEVHGNFENSLQTYMNDDKIDAEAADEIILNNAYLNILYTNGNFTAGIRYESYLNALMDYDRQYKGNGMPYRFLSYSSGNLEITAGSYYEQFGSGLVLRTYEDKGLGVDNALDGIRLKYSPLSGLYLKTFIGKSRTYFDYSKGIIRGADMEINVNEAIKLEGQTSYIIGGSIVSRYQEDNNPIFVLPENVSAMAARINIMHGGFSYYGEYAYKINDPIGTIKINDPLEKNNYAPGRALVNNLSYSQKGFGINIESHWVDHMEFRSQRSNGKQFIMNYIPTLTKQYGYTLLALYPCATQTEGEFGFQTDVYYKFNKGTPIGGKYGTKINLNFSKINGIKGGSSFLDDNTNTSSKFLSFDKDNLYFSDLNLEVYKKINKDLRLNIVVAMQKYNKDVMEFQKNLEGKTIGEYGIINSYIGVADITYKIKKGHSIRIELQELISKDDSNAEKKGEGHWAMALAEYTISPNWFFSIQDMYNHGNYNKEKRLHYVNVSIGYIKGVNRFEIGYGKKRAGIFCVGGVCKEVPSSNGFSLGVSSSF